MYQPYFSQSAIQRLESSIYEKVEKLLAALQAATTSSKVVDLTLAYKCLTADVVIDYCYGKALGALDAPDFGFKLIEDLEGLFGTASFTWYFPRLFNNLSRFLSMLPIGIVEKTMEPLAAAFEIRKVICLPHPTELRLTCCGSFVKLESKSWRVSRRTLPNQRYSMRHFLPTCKNEKSCQIIMLSVLMHWCSSLLVSSYWIWYLHTCH